MHVHLCWVSQLGAGLWAFFLPSFVCFGWEVRVQGPSQQHLGIRESPVGSGVHWRTALLVEHTLYTRIMQIIFNINNIMR